MPNYETYFHGNNNQIGCCNIGILILHDETEDTDSISVRVNWSTEPLSQYLALKHLLKTLMEIVDDQSDVIINTDSEMVYKQITDQWNIRKGVYVFEAYSCKYLLHDLKKIAYSVNVQIITEQENKEVINLSNKPRVTLNYELKKLVDIITVRHNNVETETEYAKRIEILPEALPYIKRIKDRRKKQYALNNYYDIKNKKIRVEQYAVSDRNHSQVTTLDRYVRQNYLRVDGQRLIEVDVSNCQLAIFSGILTDPKKFTSFIDEPEMQYQLYVMDPVYEQDAVLFKSLSSEGKIYSYLANIFGYNNNNLESIKIATYRLFFGPTNYSLQEHITFAEKFPSVNKAMEILKKRRYNHFAILLQTIESEIIIRKTLARIYNENQDLWGISLNDSILTIDEPRNYNTIKNILREEFEIVTGVVPTVNIKKD